MPEKFIIETEKLFEEAKLMVLEAIRRDEISYDRSEIAEYLKEKKILRAGIELNYVAGKIFDEIKDSI